MKNTVVVDLAWGDCGKGRIIDYLTFPDGREVRATCQEFFDKIIKINQDLTSLLE